MSLITGPRTVYLDKTGPRLRYNPTNAHLLIDDLNPEQHMIWVIPRSELIKVCFRLIWLAIRG